MRIVFMGTPEFAAKSLQRLYDDGYDIAGVFTAVDKPKNRGMKMNISAVKQLALSKGTQIYQPATLKDGECTSIVKELNCDIIVVVAYGRMLPKEILDLPPHSCINIHGSLLPKYRGASPIQYAVLNDEKETGVTSAYITEKMDAGDIIMTKTLKIGENETSQDLFERLGILGAELLSETISLVGKGKNTRTPQNDDEATYAPLITKDMAPIDWNKRASEIKAHVRGLIPFPVATIKFNNNTLKVFSVDVTDNNTGKSPGTIISYGKHGIEIAAVDYSVIIKEIQAAGGKRMQAADYIRGNLISKEI